MDRAIIGLGEGTHFSPDAIKCDNYEQDPVGQSGNLWNVARCLPVLWLRLFAKDPYLVLILCFVSSKHSVEFFGILLQGGLRESSARQPNLPDPALKPRPCLKRGLSSLTYAHCQIHDDFSYFSSR
jgi:hypothetical protein